MSAPRRTDLTSSERRTYSSLLARGVREEDAYNDALDGVLLDDIKAAARDEVPNV